MNFNKKLFKITSLVTLVSFVFVIFFERNSIYYDITLAIFGSAALSCLTAIISYNFDKRRINRTVISNVLQIQKEAKKILSEYNKILDNWDEKDFYEVYLVIHKLIDEFLSFSFAIKLETGKEMVELFKTQNITQIYTLFIELNRKIYNISELLKDGKKKDAYDKYKESRDLDEEIIEIIKIVLREEYGKNFAKVNSIGLL